MSHILLEASPTFANTIQRYQKAKPVMAEPSYLPLRSPVKFNAGTRERVLDAWQENITQYQVNVRYAAEVSAIEGSRAQLL